MNAHPHPGTNDPDIEPDIGLSEGQRLPTAEAVQAATLALMTGHAQACCDEHRWVMLTKIVANLHLLAHHPGVSPGFKTVAEQLYAMWARLREEWQEQEHEPAQPSSQPSAQRSPAQAATPPAAKSPLPTHQPAFTPSRQPRVLWHASPEIIQ